MARQKIDPDQAVRQGDVSADVDKDGTVLITVGGPSGDPLDHDHIETDSGHAIALYNVLSAIIEWDHDVD